jgi:hypothetical protein
MIERIGRDRGSAIDAWNRRSAVSATVPTGFKVVPVEPTEEMLDMGMAANVISRDEDTDGGFPREVANDVYRAMIEAAPEAKS